MPSTEESTTKHHHHVSLFLSRRIRVFRDRRRMTIEDVAEKIGASVQVVTELESGSRPLDVPTLWELAVIFDAELEEFFDSMAQPERAAMPHTWLEVTVHAQEPGRSETTKSVRQKLTEPVLCHQIQSLVPS